MNPGDHTIEVTGLSPNATEEDVYDFFSFSGAIQHVEIVRQHQYVLNYIVLELLIYKKKQLFSIGIQGARIFWSESFLDAWSALSYYGVEFGT